MSVLAAQFVATVLLGRHDSIIGLDHTTDDSSRAAGIKMVQALAVVEEALVDGVMVPLAEPQLGLVKPSRDAASRATKIWTTLQEEVEEN